MNLKPFNVRFHYNTLRQKVSEKKENRIWYPGFEWPDIRKIVSGVRVYPNFYPTLKYPAVTGIQNNIFNFH